MNCTEDQFRSILRQEAADITAESVPPLRQPDASPARLQRAASRGRRWLIPLSAAAAVTAIAVAATVLAGGGQPPKPSVAAPGLWHGVPEYYLAENPVDATPTVVVDDTRTGRTLATARLAKDCGATQASGAADDRTFAIACDLLGEGGAGPTERLYLARFSPAAHRLSVTALRLPLIAYGSNIALSANGTRLAVMSYAGSMSHSPAALGTETLSVYSIATGTVRTWAAKAILGWSGGVSWVRGPLLAFDYEPTATNWVYSPELPGSGIRLLNTNAPSGSLVGASRLAVPTTHLPGGYLRLMQGPQGHVVVSGNGATVATALSMKRGAQGAAEYAEFSLATGKLLRRWLPSADPLVFWSSFSGRILAVQGIFTGLRADVPGCCTGGFSVGIMTGDQFTPLPRPAAGAEVLAF